MKRIIFPAFIAIATVFAAPAIGATTYQMRVAIEGVASQPWGAWSSVSYIQSNSVGYWASVQSAYSRAGLDMSNPDHKTEKLVGSPCLEGETHRFMNYVSTRTDYTIREWRQSCVEAQ